MSHTKTIALSQLGDIPVVIKTKRDIADETPLDKRDDESLGWGYWDRIWPSEVALSEFLIKNFFPHKLQGQTVLEIGCGVGVAGIVAAQLGASTTFSDMVPVTLEGIKESCQLNNITDFDTYTLDWFAPINLGNLFDIVLGSEVFYDEKNLPEISTVLRSALKSGGQGIFCDPNRLGLGTIEFYFQEYFRFSVEEIPLDYTLRKATGGQKKIGYVYTLVKKT
ncbi:class I SAM-dependent methyltransferase [Nitrospira sp. M1]